MQPPKVGFYVKVQMNRKYFEQKLNHYGIPIINEIKGYTHFDARFSMKNCWDYISNPLKVASHSFFPFIRYEQVFDKYVVSDKKNNEREKKVKEREICYASHIDSCIYTYYAAILNANYDEALRAVGIDYEDNGAVNSSVVAYRDVLEGKSNINFAHDAIQFIRKINNCMVIVGDFKNFFNSLNHKYLKEQIKTILKVDELSDDWYSVFKSITKYSYVDLAQLMFRICRGGECCLKERYIRFNKDEPFSCKNGEHRKLGKVCHDDETYAQIQKFAAAAIVKKNGKAVKCYKGHCANRFCRKAFNSLEKIDINLVRKAKLIKYPHNINSNGVDERVGIPQGSSISAVFANVYMFDFDKSICNYVNKLGGKYMRYSDDFILILPRDDKFADHLKFLQSKVCEGKVTLEDDKTKIFDVNLEDETPIKSCSSKYLSGGKDIKDAIDYLGFTFDGKDVTIKSKTIFKYYYRMYSKIKYIKQQRETGKDKVGTANLYKNYTSKSFHWKEKSTNGKCSTNIRSGNFLTYVRRAKAIFKEDKDIDAPVRHHLSKIASRFNKGD